MSFPTYTTEDMVAPPPKNAQNKASIDKINDLRTFARDASTAMTNNPPVKKRRLKMTKSDAVADYIFEMNTADDLSGDAQAYVSGSMSVKLAGRDLVFDDISFTDGDDFCELQTSDDATNGSDGYVKINPTVWDTIGASEKLIFEYNATIS